MTEDMCRCGSGKDFDSCCGPVLAGASPRTPEELMRARYTAHCLKNYPFLVESTHPERRSDVNEKDIADWAEHVTWTGLEVHSATPGTGNDEGQVSFTAHFSIKDVPQELREDAVFLKEGERWYYVDGHVHGQPPYVREAPRVGRNDPCHCGSGRKYKKCCGR